jgi:hypothetical protein
MAYNGYKAALRASGDPITLTDAATTKLSGTGIDSNTQYQITNVNQQILAPFEDITVEVNGVIANPSTYSLNRLLGKVTFHSPNDSGDEVTITGKYIPTSLVAEAYEFTYTLEGSNEAKHTFASSWEKRWQAGKDFTAELSQWYDVNFSAFNDAITSSKVLVIEFFPTGVSGEVDLRAWVLVGSQEISGSAGGLLEESIEFEGTTDNDGRTVA